MNGTGTQSLAGTGVLITRPAHQAGRLAALVSERGGRPVLFPALEIEPVRTARVVAAFDRIGQFDLAVFVSPNAARIAMAGIAAAGGMPAHLEVAAIGPATSAELGKSGLGRILTGDGGFDSESLLRTLPAARVRGKHVAIFRGEGGRELLGDTLRSRGARVEYVECYRRIMPRGDLKQLLPLWEDGGIGASIATSAQIVANLFGMAQGDALQSWLQRTPMIVSHPRVADAAFLRGVHTLIVGGAGDDLLVSCLETWFGRLRPVAPAL